MVLQKYGLITDALLDSASAALLACLREIKTKISCLPI